MFSLYDFPFCREQRDSFQVHPRSKSLKNTLDGVNFSTKNTELLDRYFLRILFLELMTAILQNDKFNEHLFL